MAEMEEIEAFAREVAEKFSPEQVILFGSSSSGSATPDSDVDILVIMKYLGRASAQALAIRKAVRKKFPLDLVVQSPGEARRRMRLGDPFVTNALTHGRVLYARTQY